MKRYCENCKHNRKELCEYPCSEHQPTEDGEYITTVEDGEGMFVTSNDWRQDWKQWGFWSVDEEYDEVWRRVTNVVAWMELPEPWRA